MKEGKISVHMNFLLPCDKGKHSFYSETPLSNTLYLVYDHKKIVEILN